MKSYFGDSQSPTASPQKTALKSEPQAKFQSPNAEREGFSSSIFGRNLGIGRGSKLGFESIADKAKRSKLVTQFLIFRPHVKI